MKPDKSDTIRTIWSRTASLFRSKRLDAELEEELRTHIALAQEEHMQRGMSPQHARSAALRSFGGVTQIQEHYRNQRGIPMLEQLNRDLRFGLRQLRKSPGFAAVVIGSLNISSHFENKRLLSSITLPRS